MYSRHELLKQINEISFIVNDLTLYLDTHPTDEQALSLFDSHLTERKQLLSEYEQQFEPLTIDSTTVNKQHDNHDFCNYPTEKHFNWVDGPTPWEGGHI